MIRDHEVILTAMIDSSCFDLFDLTDFPATLVQVCNSIICASEIFRKAVEDRNGHTIP